jgi:hypothetical protein
MNSLAAHRKVLGANYDTGCVCGLCEHLANVRELLGKGCWRRSADIVDQRHQRDVECLRDLPGSLIQLLAFREAQAKPMQRRKLRLLDISGDRGCIAANWRVADPCFNLVGTGLERIEDCIGRHLLLELFRLFRSAIKFQQKTMSFTWGARRRKRRKT